MASYQMKQRDPLFDSNMQAVIERRGKELLGLGLIALGVLVAMMLGSYVPEDPSWLSATDEPAANMLGRTGAMIAGPLYIIAGLGSWGLAACLVGWGLRFVLHRGEERAVGRVIFAPIAIALGSVYASTLVPSEAWTHSFGLGGLFGDTVLAAILNILPMGAALGLKLMAFASGLALVAMALFVLGFDGRELRLTGRFLLVGMIMAYGSLMTLLGRGATGAVQGAQAWQARRQARRDAVIEDDMPFDEADYTPAPLAAPEPRAKPGLLARMPALVKRAPDPEPELVEPEFDPQEPILSVSEDRIKAKIADVIK
jgi:S-DNA-T family DNA segregation ATPase FtsK/SpoIIIE